MRTSNLGCRYFFLIAKCAQAALAASGRTIETAPKPPPGALHPSLPQINRFEPKKSSQNANSHSTVEFYSPTLGVAAFRLPLDRIKIQFA